MKLEKKICGIETLSIRELILIVKPAQMKHFGTSVSEKEIDDLLLDRRPIELILMANDICLTQKILLRQANEESGCEMIRIKPTKNDR